MVEMVTHIQTLEDQLQAEAEAVREMKTINPLLTKILERERRMARALSDAISGLEEIKAATGTLMIRTVDQAEAGGPA